MSYLRCYDSSDRYRLYVHCLGIKKLLVWSLGTGRNARLAQNFESVPGWIQINFIIWDSVCIFVYPAALNQSKFKKTSIKKQGGSRTDKTSYNLMS